MTYKNCKKVIENKRYQYEDMIKKLDVFLLNDRITVEQYDELVKLIEGYNNEK